MKKRILNKRYFRLLVKLVFFFYGAIAFSQRKSVLRTAEQVEMYYKMPQERIDIHINNSLFFTGEYMFFSVYNFIENTNKVSDLSKVAYVELLNSKNQIILKQKILLDKGRGQGDYFVSTNIPSGNYKMIGYTQWMLNQKDPNYFEADISILNPYQSNQKSIVQASDSAQKTEKIKTTRSNLSNEIKIITDKKIYDKRSLVHLNFQTPNVDKYDGTYSLSIRKKDSFTSALINKSYTAKKAINKELKIGDSLYMPELRGELMYGKIISQNLSDSLQIDLGSKKVSVSFINENENLQLLNCSKTGNFIFNIPKQYQSKELVFQVLDSEDKYRIEIYEFPKRPKKEFQFFQFKIDSSQKQQIVNRSIQNQIENNYYSVKPDSIIVNSKKKLFDVSELIVYELDDYKRFSSIKQTVVEITKEVAIKAENSETPFFWIRGQYLPQKQTMHKPLLIVDGVQVENHKRIIDFDPEKIEKINLFCDTYFLGSRVYDGVILIETFDKYFLNNLIENDAVKISLTNPNISKKYFRQDYSKLDKKQRIPDFRSQLLWEPNININAAIEFYTSDIAGEYIIELIGVSNSGKKHYFFENIVVK